MSIFTDTTRFQLAPPPFELEKLRQEKAIQDKYMTAKEHQPKYDHPLYEQYHFLLSYKFKNEQNHVKTAYLDRISRSFRGQSRSEEQYYYYYVYIKIIQQVYRHNVNILYNHKFHDKIEKHFRQFLVDACTYFLQEYKSEKSYARRNGVEMLLFKIYERFNQTLDEYNQKYIFDLKPYTIQLPTYSNQPHQLPPVNARRRGRPRKEHIQIYHPDLYGF